MNWIQFLLWITGLYMLYYLLVILFDIQNVSIGKRGVAADRALVFETEADPILVMPEQPDQESSRNSDPLQSGNLGQALTTEVIASGGVTVKEIFSLAREDALIYTRAVTF